MTKPRRLDEATAWRPPTRRTFVAMISAAAAGLAIGKREQAIAAAEPPPTRPRWIGHC
ncbi:hypothetical protein BH11MYX3_BH11MYX3_05380 [soil metagenome]